MPKYRIVATVLVATVCATTDLHAQFAFTLGEPDQVVAPAEVPYNTSCGLQDASTRWSVWGHYPVSWRRWPQDVSEYTTNPQLSPFVIPDRSGMPEADVPDALNETLYSPRKRDPLPEGGSQQSPSTDPNTGTESDTSDLPSLEPEDEFSDPAGDLLPNTEDTVPDSGTSDLSPQLPGDSDPEVPADSGTFDSDLFDDLDTGPTPDTGGGLDDLLNGDDGLEGFGKRQPRRYQRRAARNLDADRSFDFQSSHDPPREVEPAGFAGVDESEGRANPLRRGNLTEQARPPQYAQQYQPAPSRDEYRVARRRVDNYPYAEPIDPRYDARQIDYREYQRRQNLYRYGAPREPEQNDPRYSRYYEGGGPAYHYGPYPEPADRYPAHPRTDQPRTQMDRPPTTSTNPLRR